MPSTAKFDRLTLFSFAWAVATLFHALSFPERINLSAPLSWLVMIAAGLVVLRPYSVRLFALLLLISVGNTLTFLPYTPNHILFEFILNGGMLVTLAATLGREYVRNRERSYPETTEDRSALFGRIAPVARVSLLILYFYGVFHKLNWDYFNSEISCSTFLLESYGDRLPFLPVHPVTRLMAVWGTLLAEAAIPLLLCIRRTRPAGIVLGFGFHLLLSLHPHRGLYSFSALLYALFLLFVPSDFPQKLYQTAQHRFGSLLPKLIVAGQTGIAVSALVLVGAALSGFSRRLTLVGLLLWLGWAMVVIAGYVTVLVRHKFGGEQPAELLRIKPVWLGLVPLLIFANGLSPYAGLKTESSFSMFSNLRTEGGISNHLIVPVSVQVADFQWDLVQVVDTDLANFRPFITDNQLINYVELRRIAAEAPADFFVTYVRNDSLRTVSVKNGVSNRPDLTTPHPWLTHKFVQFRPVDRGPCLCKH